MTPVFEEDPEGTGILAGVRARLGDDCFRRRIATEEFRDAEFRRILTTKGTYLKIHYIRPVERAILWCLGLWGRGRGELLGTVVRENTVLLGDSLPRAFDGFRILHLTDLHIDIDPRLVQSISRAVSKIDYDICVMTGDYRSMTIGPIDGTLALMRALRPALRGEVLAVLGNHDPLGLVPGLEEAGFSILLNEARVLRRGADALCFAGVDDPVVFGTDDLEKALSAAPPGAAKIVLSHSPRLCAEAGRAGASLLLCGHTHGGQICLPGGRMLFGNEGMPRCFLKGAWRRGSLHGYTSAGCGASGLPCRLNCPAEVVLHTLRREAWHLSR